MIRMFQVSMTLTVKVGKKLFRCVRASATEMVAVASRKSSGDSCSSSPEAIHWIRSMASWRLTPSTPGSQLNQQGGCPQKAKDGEGYWIVLLWMEVAKSCTTNLGWLKPKTGTSHV